MRINFSPPDITELEINEVVEALKSGWITTGPRTKELEKKIAEQLGTPKSVCLNSATAALEMSLRVLGIGPGDEVITSAYSYTASASPVVHVGATLVLVDTQKDSYEMDYDAVARAITPKTKAIIPVDIAGVPCNYERLQSIVEEKKSLFTPSNDIQSALGHIPIVADCAHSFGASYKGVPTGNVADFSSFSFHAVKNFTTAEGGCATWRHIDGIDDEVIYKQFQLLSLHGQDKDALAKIKAGAWEYDIKGTYYKCNMTDIMASIGLVQLQRYDNEILQKKKELVSYYEKYLKDLTDKIELPIFKDDDKESCRHLYMIRLKNQDEEKRNEVIAKLGENDIATNVHFQPLPLLTAYKNLGFKIEYYPNAYNQYKNEISLPLHDFLSEDDIKYICEYIKKLI